MSKREQRRASCSPGSWRAEMEVAEASALLGLSKRSVRRLQAVMEREGPTGLVHGNRGRVSPRRLDETMRARTSRERRTPPATSRRSVRRWSVTAHPARFTTTAIPSSSRPSKPDITLEEQLVDTRAPTQLGRAFAELGIGSIKPAAPSPKVVSSTFRSSLWDRLESVGRGMAIWTTVAARQGPLIRYLDRLHPGTARCGPALST